MEVQKIGDNIYYLVLIGTSGGLLLALSLIFFFVRYKRRFIRQHANMQKAELDHRQMLLHSVIQSQEEERIRISKDLHDHVGGSLSGLRLQISRILNSGLDAAAIKHIGEESRASIDRIIEDVRNVSHSLSPAGLELWGFHEALDEYCEKMAGSSGVKIRVTDGSGGILKELSFEDALSLFRVIQELITNTIKHASAANISIETTANAEQVVIKYTDDGKGMDTSGKGKHGIGMYNMESRLSMIGAAYSITSSPGAGYWFLITLPVKRLHKTTKHGED